eukprot:scaffold289_cov57-Phaeocystis_antarctica.AAC.1
MRVVYARAARPARRRCFREPPVAREASIDYHAALRHAPVLRVALPRRQRLWRWAANQRHGRSADPRPSAEHECRRAEQGEQRWASRLALCKRRLREALAGAHRPWYLWRAKAGATEGGCGVGCTWAACLCLCTCEALCKRSRGMSFICVACVRSASEESAEQARRDRLARLNFPPGGAERVHGACRAGGAPGRGRLRVGTARRSRRTGRPQGVIIVECAPAWPAGSLEPGAPPRAASDLVLASVAGAMRIMVSSGGWSLVAYVVFEVLHVLTTLQQADRLLRLGNKQPT